MCLPRSVIFDHVSYGSEWLRLGLRGSRVKSPAASSHQSYSAEVQHYANKTPQTTHGVESLARSDSDWVFHHAATNRDSLNKHVQHATARADKIRQGSEKLTHARESRSITDPAGHGHVTDIFILWAQIGSRRDLIGSDELSQVP